LKSHSFFGLLTRATTRGTPYSVFARRETTRLTLSSPVAAITTFAALQRRLVQGRDLAGVGQQPLRLGDPLDRDRGRGLVDEKDLVTVLQQLSGDRTTDRAGSGNGDPHQ